MKFVIQQYGDKWLFKAYLGNEDAQAVNKGGNEVRDVADDLTGALNRAVEIAAQQGLTPDQIGGIVA